MTEFLVFWNWNFVEDVADIAIDILESRIVMHNRAARLSEMLSGW